MRLVAFGFVALLAVTGMVRAQSSGTSPAVPLEPIAAILDAFRTHQVVALSDGRQHGDVEAHALVMRMLRAPRFADTVTDIVLECCSARYQDVVDRYVNGDVVAERELAPAWRNATQVNARQGDGGAALDYFRTIRLLNAGRPRERRLRVLLGDPPIDWAAVHSDADHRRWIEMRDTFPAALIGREVVAKGRHALVVYGGMHLQRKQLAANYESTGLAATLISALEDATKTRAFTVWFPEDLRAIDPGAASWPLPAFALVAGTRLGALDFAEFARWNTLPRIRIRDGKPDFAAGPIPREQWRTLPMEQQFDDVLDLGQAMTIADGLTPGVCTDTEFTPTLRSRMAIVGLQPEIDRLAKYCQGAQPAAPAFEVASIKPNNSGAAEGGIRVQPGGRFAWTNMTLKQLIGTAYGFDQREILGGSAWLSNERFDVIAQVEAGVPAVDASGSPGPLFTMLRALLEERFQVRAHRESVERPVYALMLARPDGRVGARLVRSDIDCAAVTRDQGQGKRVPLAPGGLLPCAIRAVRGRVDASAIGLQRLAGVLSRIVDKPVVDRSGLRGNYDVTLEFRPEFQAAFDVAPEPFEPAADPNAPSIFTAVQEQLGLKLESTRAPIDVLVIDRAERPTEN
jgi:uncharacterized protein (TIGR03435 family)